MSTSPTKKTLSVLNIDPISTGILFGSISAGFSLFGAIALILRSLGAREYGMGPGAEIYLFAIGYPILGFISGSIVGVLSVLVANVFLKHRPLIIEVEEETPPAILPLR